MFDIIDSENERIYILKKDNISSIVNIFEEKINEFIKNDKRDMVLDLGSLSVIDSLTLAAFIRFRKKLFVEERNFRIINYNDNILRVIELAGLEDFLL